MGTVPESKVANISRRPALNELARRDVASVSERGKSVIDLSRSTEKECLGHKRPLFLPLDCCVCY